MDSNQAIEVIAAITALLSALVWPLVALFVILRFAPRLIGLVETGRGVTIKALGIEATFTNSVAKAAVALSAATAKQAEEEEAEVFGETVPAEDAPAHRRATVSAPSPGSVANTVTESIPDAQAQQDLQGATVLWVDDNPDNNRFEREAFEAVGIRFELSTSTEDALQQLTRRRFDAVISDMSRGQERQAGYELLDRLRQRNDSTPFFIYAGSSAVRHREEALARGAQGSTNSPQELMALVVQTLRQHRRP